MARRELVADTARKLVSWKIGPDGNIYGPGHEADLPEGFEMDGPHWNDWLPEAKDSAVTLKGAAAQRFMGDDTGYSELKAVPVRPNAEGTIVSTGILEDGTEPMDVASKAPRDGQRGRVRQ